MLSEQAGSSYEASGYSSKTAGGEQSDDIKLLKKSEASVTHENLLGGAAKEDKKLEASHGLDTQQWYAYHFYRPYICHENFTCIMYFVYNQIDSHCRKRAL